MRASACAARNGARTRTVFFFSSLSLTCLHCAHRWANDDLGVEAYGAIDNPQGLELIRTKGPFAFCCLGCVFVNDKFWAQELNEMKAALDEAGIPYAKMPTFGDVRTILTEAGLYEAPQKKQPIAIAG